jgi:hypothetical protein
MRFVSCGHNQSEITDQSGVKCLMFRSNVLAVMLGVRGPVLVNRDVQDYLGVKNLTRWLLDKAQCGVIRVDSAVIKQVVKHVKIF